MEIGGRKARRKLRHVHRSVTCYLLALLAASTLVTACASMDAQGDIYTIAETRSPEAVLKATVERVRTVEIDTSTQTSRLAGEIGGGLLGAVAGTAIGEARGSLLSGIAGGLAGSFAGHELEDRLRREPGLEITVRLPDSRLQAITQPTSEGAFYPGEPVLLLTGMNGRVRVTK